MNHQPRSARSNVRRLATGRLISVTGGAAAYTALQFTVWETTHSPGMQALSLLLTFGVAGILGPLGGALGDRFDRRTVMIVSEAVAASFFLAMAFVDATGILIALAFGSAIAELPFFSSSRAAIPNLVDDESQLSWANSLVTIGVHAGITVGPVLGGLLLAGVGASWVFALNAVSFLVSLVITLTVHGSFQQEDAADEGEHAGMAAGVLFLWRDRVMRRMSGAWLVFLLGMGIGMVADAALAESFGAGPIGFALLITCWGTGSVAGSAAGRWMSQRSEPFWLVAGAFGISVAAFGVGFAPAFALVLIALFLMGTFDGLTIVAENGIMQRRTPDAVRSRTMAAFEAVLSAGLAVAYLLAGPALDLVGAQGVYRIGGATALVAAVTLVPLLRLRHEADGSDLPEGPQQEGERFTSAEELESAVLWRRLD
ncbi:MAG: MFS transporter [Actinomycetota bacterium]